jgi:hypothetical protein
LRIADLGLRIWDCGFGIDAERIAKRHRAWGMELKRDERSGETRERGKKIEVGGQRSHSGFFSR